jgi:hypothetical protein
LKTIALANDSGHSATVLHAGKPVAASLQGDGKQILVTLKHPVKLSPGEKLEIIIG